jgi:hypothetical protein
MLAETINIGSGNGLVWLLIIILLVLLVLYVLKRL